jgi:DNA topoisomerase VI subunit B
MPQSFERSVFTVSREMEFFSVKELTMQIGHPPPMWPLAVIKELIDNGLDATESREGVPTIEVCLADDHFTVTDNGPGIPRDVVRRSRDLNSRVSDKCLYVSPTRGQQGNGLKTVWAAPFVACGEEAGVVEVSAQGVLHRLTARVDHIAGVPRIDLEEQSETWDCGTRVKVFWPGLSRHRIAADGPSLRGATASLIREYSTFNPHARFSLRFGDVSLECDPTRAGWSKWLTDSPSSPWWYTPERLRDLVAGLLKGERERGGKKTTVRELIGKFAKLSGTRKQKIVFEKAALPGDDLADLVVEDDIDLSAVERLLLAMRDDSKPYQPVALGLIGKAHLVGSLVEHFDCTDDSILYRSMAVVCPDGMPYLIEAALGVSGDDELAVSVGVNWSPALGLPMVELYQELGDNKIDECDNVAVVVHIACPRIDYTDRGKSRLALPPAVLKAVANCMYAISKRWRDVKRPMKHFDKVSKKDVQRARKPKSPGVSIKEAAFEVMEQAYMHASSNGTLPANARQIMYAARPLVLKRTADGGIWKGSAYFTQKLLPRYIEENPRTTEAWDVVYDARGQILEPHTGHRVPLGTLQVRKYLAGWKEGFDEEIDDVDLPIDVPTLGPKNRYRYALFIEKEGFNSRNRSPEFQAISKAEGNRLDSLLVWKS